MLQEIAPATCRCRLVLDADSSDWWGSGRLVQRALFAGESTPRVSVVCNEHRFVPWSDLLTVIAREQISVNLAVRAIADAIGLGQEFELRVTFNADRSAAVIDRWTAGLTAGQQTAARAAVGRLRIPLSVTVE